MSKLKSCPFCAGRAILERKQDKDGYDEYCYRIACELCHCGTSFYYHVGIVSKKLSEKIAKDSAKEAWNRRR